MTKRHINILVLGETGVGKSTFINAFVNYMSFKSLSEAEKASEVTCLIPCKFTVTDDDYKERIVSIGDDKNECKDVGASATQATKAYSFPIGYGNTYIRIIDTPGIGDTRGIGQDNRNFENILDHLELYEELHGICILLKPNNARLNVLFEFCVKQLLSRLEKSASENIIFVFTNSRSTFYRPGDTYTALKKILEEIESRPPYVRIPLQKENIFCLDNEAFRFLVSIKNSVSFTAKEKKDFANSWENSSQACWNLISYISGDANQKGRTPHKIENTISINRARMVVIQLSQPLAEIAQLCIDNQTVLKRHKQNLKHSTDNLEELRSKLYMPVINLKAEEFSQPRTVCATKKCCSIYQVGGITKWHYKTRCHDPCYLKNVPKELVGAPELVNCAAINSSTKQCKQCFCDFSTHMHIYYQTEVVYDKIVDVNINNKLTDQQTVLNDLKSTIDKINRGHEEYKKEKEFIIKTMAKFAHFLQNNAITPYNDSYETYIEYLIDRENSLGSNSDKKLINQLRDLIKQHREEKAALDSALKLNKNTGNENNITAGEIFSDVEKLYKLKNTGAKIKELFDKQSGARKYEVDANTEYVHSSVIQMTENNPSKKKHKNKGEEKNRSISHSNSESTLADSPGNNAVDSKQKNCKMAGNNKFNKQNINVDRFQNRQYNNQNRGPHVKNNGRFDNTRVFSPRWVPSNNFNPRMQNNYPENPPNYHQAVHGNYPQNPNMNPLLNPGSNNFMQGPPNFNQNWPQNHFFPQSPYNQAGPSPPPPYFNYPQTQQPPICANYPQTSGVSNHMPLQKMENLESKIELLTTKVETLHYKTDNHSKFNQESNFRQSPSQSHFQGAAHSQNRTKNHNYNKSFNNYRKPTGANNEIEEHARPRQFNKPRQNQFKHINRRNNFKKGKNENDGDLIDSEKFKVAGLLSSSDSDDACNNFNKCKDENNGEDIIDSKNVKKELDDLFSSSSSDSDENEKVFVAKQYPGLNRQEEKKENVTGENTKIHNLKSFLNFFKGQN